MGWQLIADRGGGEFGTYGWWCSRPAVKRCLALFDGGRVGWLGGSGLGEALDVAVGHAADVVADRALQTLAIDPDLEALWQQ